MAATVDQDQIVRQRMEVTGRVQGVGFRPFVYNLARGMELVGFVANSSFGAVIEVQGSLWAIERFRDLLVERQPPLAKIGRITCSSIPAVDEREFAIRTSHHDGSASAEVTIDSAVCEDCLGEMFDPGDRRHGYPFINCTNCGPRYTIVRSIPYDRPNTTMSTFQMCPQCRREYEDPGNRRFHAQPIACPACGPKLTLVGKTGEPVPGDPITETIRLLRSGGIVAVKGIGGFHLAVDATDSDAVTRLRRLKKRDYKPFAIMADSIETIGHFCLLDEASCDLLEDISRPIVILPRRPGNTIADDVAPGLDRFAVMLPYAPVHYLIFAKGLGPLVMTSGNVTDEPLAKDNDEALARLAGMADAFLVHNRPIYRRLDDSVVQFRSGRFLMIRRARGFVPQRYDLGCQSPRAILAVGAELKNTVTMVKGCQAVTSEHIGDLRDAVVFDHFTHAIDHLSRLLSGLSFDAVCPPAQRFATHPGPASPRPCRIVHGGTRPAR